MNLKLILSLSVLCVLSSCSVSTAQNDAAEQKHMEAKTPAQLTEMKKLVGNWVGRKVSGAEHEGMQTENIPLTYEMTSGGSAIVEKIFAGTPHEMVTVYHAIDNGIMLTHFCMLNNQPRMKYEGDGNDKELVFKYLDGANLDPKNDQHMHDAVITRIDENTLKHAWTSYSGGKQQSVEVMEFTRTQ